MELPLTGAQRGIWNAQRLEPDSRHYVVGDVLEIVATEALADAGVELLVEAVRRTVDEAETLRLRVHERPDGPVQTIDEAATPAPRVVDLRGERRPREVAEALVDAERHRVGERLRGMTDRPLHAFTVVRLTDREVWWLQLHHHLVIDGYSAFMISRRAAAIYSALRAGHEVPRSPFGRFADLVEADRAYAASPDHAADRAYWVDAMTPVPTPATGAGPGTAGPPDRTVTAREVVPPEEMDRLRAVADAVGVTWGDVVIAGYAGFLARMLGATDVVFALPLMGRLGSAALRTPCMAVNVLPLRVDVALTDTLGDLAERVAAAMTDLRAHQRYRGEDLPRDLGVPGAGALLHGAGINLKAFDVALDFAGAVGTLRNVAGGPPEDWGLSALPTRDGGLLLGFEVDARTHDRPQVAARLAAMRAILRSWPGDPDGEPPVLGRLDLVEPAVARRIVTDARTPAVSDPVPVPEVLDRLAATHRDRVVLVDHCGGPPFTLTAGMLAAAVHRLARVLRARGVGPDDVVALALPRGRDLVVGLLATLHAGAGYLALDLAQPAARRRALMQQAAPVVVLGAEADGGTLDPATANLAAVSAAPLAAHELAAPRDPEHLSALVFTSGTTGTPKGVLGRAGALAEHLARQQATVMAGYDGPLRVAHTYSFAFDASLDQLAWLLAGHELHLYPGEVARDVEALLAALRRDRVDVVDTTPSLAAPLIDAGLLDDPPRVVVLGGEATGDALWATLAAQPGVTAWNLYGPTEATVDTTGARIAGPRPTIGRALPGTAAHVLDPALRPVADGATGELYVSGPHLARGYLGHPATTADRFPADPFGPPGSRMYRTGDVVRRLGDGRLEFVGRDDDQVTIRGHRVELGEVEAALTAAPGVRRAAALVRTETGHPRLIGYVVGAPGSAPDPAALRDRLAEELPDHLVPAAVVVLDALPTTSNGKLDRTALPAPDTGDTGRGAATGAEQVLAEVVAEVLALDAIGVERDFFSLGGDSITAIAVSSRARARGLALRPRDLFDRRSIAALAADLPAETGETGETAAGPVPGDDPTGDLPAPPIVDALLAAHPDLDAIAGYAQWTAVTTPSGLDTDLVATGLAAVLDAHPALRLVLGPDRDLVVRPGRAVDATRLVRAVERVDAGSAAGLAAELAAELDPRTGDLVRVGVAPGALLVVVHHLVVDGVSWRVLLPDLHRAVTRAGAGLRPEVAAEGTSWRRFATLLAEQGRSGARRGELAHWRAATADTLRLGARALDPARDTVRTVVRARTRASAAASRAVLATLPSAYRAGPHEVLLTALVLTVRACGATTATVPVTLEGHGREDLADGLDLARTVGWFTSEYPVAAPTAGEPGDAPVGGDATGRLLRAVKEAVRATPDSGIGYGVLRRLDPVTAPELDGPPPDLTLNFLGRFAADVGDGWALAGASGDGAGDAALAVVEPAAKALEQVLALNAFVVDAPDGERIDVEWVAAGLVLDAEALGRLTAAWDRALDALAAHAARVGPDGGGLTPSDVPLVGLDQPAIDALERTHRLADVLPATALQLGLAFHTLVREDGSDAGPDPYVVQARVDLAGPLDAGRLRDAATELLRRVDALRVVLAPTTAGDIVAVVTADATSDFSTACAGPDEAIALADAERARGVDPGVAPLIRFLLVERAPDDHLLVLTCHHALLDGWSMPLVGRTLLGLYAELGGGPAVPAPPPLAEHHRRLATRDHDAGLRAWAELLAGVETGTLLAPDARDGGEGTADAPERHVVDLGAERTARVEAFTRAHGVTVTTLLSAVWGLVLGHATGRRDVLFGQPVSGRPADVPGVESMIGQLGNTVVVRVAWEPAETGSALLAAVQDQAGAMSEHHHVGLPDVVRASGVERGELFDTLLVVENFPLADRGGTDPADGDGDGDGPTITGVDVVDATHYPLTVIVLPGETLVVGLGHRPDVLSADAVAALGRRIVRVLDQLLDDPDRPLGRLAMLDDDERRRVLALGTGPTPVRERGPMLDEFAAWVARRPDAQALVCRGRSLTYAELDRAANRLARTLLAHGVGPEDTVAVLLGRDVEMTVALFGILRAGAVYVPLDPTYPAERLRFVLADAGPRVALVDAASHAAVRDVLAGLTVLPLDDPATTAAAADTDPVRARAHLTEDALAYVIHTSGTTGRPKGVAVPRRGLPDLVSLQEDVLGVGPDVRYLHFASTSFDVAVWQTMVPLLSGGTSVIAPEEVRLPGDELVDYLRRHRVTGVNLLPSFLAAVPDDADIDPDTFFVVGAERLDPDLARRWGAGRALFNAYGPTEATVNAVTWRHDPADPGPLPIGRPDPNTQAYVLDDGLAPVAVGGVGELYLTGQGLARGYVGRPGLTAGAFVADPFGPPGTRMYRTGDLARWREDGELVFLGRADAQVKVRGYRIELAEIETVVAAHPDVSGAAVLVRSDDDGGGRGDGRAGGDRIVAYVVPSAGRAPDPVDLRAHAAAQLPEYMVPSAVVVLAALPLGPTGKLDRSALPAPPSSAPEQVREPATPAEAVLVEVLGELLHRDDLGPDQAFLDAGGDSIVALQLVSRARRHGLLLTARDVLAGGTLAGIAARGRLVAEDGGPGDPEASGAVGTAPLLPVMREFLDRCAAADVPPDGYCQWMTLVVPSAGPERWQACVDAVLARHDVLRAHLGGDGLVIPEPGSVTAADVLTVSAVTAEERYEAATAWIARARASIDVARGPLVRVLALDAGSGRTGRLVVLAHHLVVDGASWRILVDDLAAAFDGVALPRTGLPFLAWARSQAAADREWERPHRERAAASGPRPGARPLDPRRDTVGTLVRHEVRLDAGAAHTLVTTLPAAHRTTPDAVLLTGLATAVARWGGSTPFAALLEGHGRPDTVDLSATVGWFTTTHPVWLDPDPRGADRAIASVKEACAAAGDGLGWGVLRAPGEPPAVVLNYLGRLPSPPQEEVLWAPPPGADPLGSGADDAMPVPAELVIDAVSFDDGTLGLRVGWPDGVFPDGSPAELAEHLRDVLGDLAADPLASRAPLTPSDVPLVDLGQAALDRLQDAAGDAGVADVLPLTGQQEVVLRHSRDRAPGTADPYAIQAAFTLDGDLDTATVTAAVARLLGRHPALTAVFPPSVPVQLIPARPRADVREVHTDDVAAALAADLGAPFDLSAGPPVRCTVVRAPGTTVLVVTTHHVVSDGWSAPRTVSELFAAYAGEDLPAPVPLARYLAWRAGRDDTADLEAWRAELDGVGPAEHVATAGEDGPRDPPVVVTVDAARVAALTRTAGAAGLTVGTVLQGAWAIVLAVSSGRDDVVFATMVANRDAEVDGVEEIVGLLAGAVPVRVRLAGDTLADTLRGLQDRRADLTGHVGMPALERLVGQEPLVDTLLTFENYPVDPSALREPAPGLRVTDVRVRETTHHPLAVTVAPEPDGGWRVVLAPRGVAPERVRELADDLVATLGRLADGALDRAPGALLTSPERS